MNIEDILSQPNRMKMMVILLNSEKVEFNELKGKLGLTSGNMSRHTATLEECGFIRVEKIFVGKKPKTLYSVSETGREAFREYLQNMKKIMEECGYLKAEAPKKEKEERISTLKNISGLASNLIK